MQSLGIAFVIKSRNIIIYLKSIIDALESLHGGLRELSTTSLQNVCVAEWQFTHI